MNRDHPTILRMAGRTPPAPSPPRDQDWFHALALEAGADDAAALSIDNPALDGQRADILRCFPGTRVVLSLVCRMNEAPVRSAVRSIANAEFHEGYDAVNAAARRIVRRLGEIGIDALNTVAAFPMEVQDFPGKTWAVSHKPIAEAAGLGRMGLHRNLIHPRFGNFVLLGTVLIDAALTEEARPLDYNPCLSCNLCVAACPVGAIGPDGDFNFTACYTHNYRDFLGGFKSWVDDIADARDAADYERRVAPAETVSMWQSLAYKPGYKAAYCLSVCPAGEEVIGPYLDDRRGFIERVAHPLRDRAETVYVTDRSDAQEWVARRFPAKTAKVVRAGVKPGSIRAFLFGLTLGFQWRKAKGIDACWHFRFTGREAAEATVRIEGAKLKVTPGLRGTPGLRIEADSDAWLAIVAGRLKPWRAVVGGKLRLKGDRRLMATFRRCFPR
ncbi:SCP2 sterol-binding domain-containing protein [Zavarzinia compransoris]|uniref:SCP2 sterol-binding domain-containing protein n=1 Tax=Zavarzinia marina TaxID=2911065 RepID=UPI001F364624|nr:SCP2 sterol-binding domain-containing protein [Zavarzinia marina]MCF4167026.1 SCP2 sterol-binding domain-containing protein [Zavarzinia marina]